MEVVQPKGWIPFIQNDSEFVWFCLTGRTSGIAGSRRLGIKDEALAWNFDNAVTLRLFRFDNEARDLDRKNLAFEVCKMAGLIHVDDDDIFADDTIDDTTQVW